LRVGWALGVALLAGGCRGSALEGGSPAGQLTTGSANDAVVATDSGTGPGTDAGSAPIGGRAGSGASADAGSPSQPDGAPGACVPLSSTAPRPLSPQSGAIVTSARPQFRWTGGTGPYRLQVCADRACDTVQAEVTSDGTATTLPQELPAGYWFWRVQNVNGPGPSWPPEWTSVWEMRVRRRFPGYAPVANSSVSGFSDYNGDGYPDAAAFGAAPMIYLGGSDGLSAGRVWQTEPNAGLGTLFMEPQADVNGDGFTDLSSQTGIALAGHPGPNYAARIQFGAESGLVPVEAFVNVAYDAYAILSISNPVGLGDFDGDGFADLIMQFRYSADLIRGCAPAPPNAVWSSLGCGNCQLQQVATGDFNGDGRSDFIFADGTEISLYMGNPNGAAPISIPGMSGLWVTDFNYDGYSDLVVKDEWPADTLHAYEGAPEGLSTTSTSAAQPPPFVLVGDFDGDGYWDTIGPGCNGDCPTIGSVSYGGPGGWGAPATRTTPMDRSIAVQVSAIVVDLNADGYDDLLVSGQGVSPIWWYAGSPTGLATVPTVTLTP
jgi:hypothetical protein